MIDWIIDAPPAELATELLSAFDPEVPRRIPWLAPSDLSDWMFRGYPKRTGIVLPARPVQEPIFEAIQLLEHSELLYVRWIQDGVCRWGATRLGLATLASGKAAVRKRIAERTGL